ncbi:hypothetical protein [Agaribacter marinus]|uniref:Uncharacterized protein n=1 Tax=Agaribacter marinus TaxID=1431249 RepID=A0AA37SZY6_9ALTE|nr:hypothetical protein [Agaribacter marinus]GLR71130.1 hypothetical protein GCM10007852_20380 [Agaribacter marinus]
MDTSETYDIETPYPYIEESLNLDADTFETMWQLLSCIFDYWELAMPTSGAKSQLLVFMQNRMKINLNYYAEYKNAACVIHELNQKFGKHNGTIHLLTSPEAAIKPANTRLARARQMVSNEFITLALSIGGFKSFGAKNALGYINGGNVEGKAPYRIFSDHTDEDSKKDI